MPTPTLIVADDIADRTSKGRLRSRLLQENAIEFSQQLNLSPEIFFAVNLRKNFLKKKDQRSFAEAFKEIVDQIKDRFDKVRSKVNVKISYGKPVDEILEEVDLTNNPYCLMLGTHGHQGLKKLILGSVAEEVVRHCPIPTFIIGPEAQKQKTTLKLNGSLQVVFLTDFSEASANAQEFALNLCRKVSCPLITIHSVGAEILQIRQSIYSSGYIPFNVDTMFNQMADDYQRKLDQFTKDLKQEGLLAQSHLIEKEERVIKSLRKFLRGKNGVIVMGTHGRNRISTSMIGSNARDVILNAPWPVIVVRNSEKK